MAYGYSTINFLAAFCENHLGHHTAIDSYQRCKWKGIGLRSWPHSGFSVDQSVFLPAGGTAGIERLIQCMTRCPFSLSRLVKVGDTGQVIYQSEKHACRAFPDPKRDGMQAGVPAVQNSNPLTQGFPLAGNQISNQSVKLYVRKENIEQLKPKYGWKFRTKHQFALERVLEVLRAFVTNARKFVTFDGAYFAKELIRPLLREGVTVVARL